MAPARPTIAPFGGPLGTSAPVLTEGAARQIAIHLHSDQNDKVGEPYWKHVVAVGEGTAVLGGSLDEIVAAYFHDSVEDGWVTLDGLRVLGATETSLAIIDAVTKRPGEPWEDNLLRVIAAGPGAMRVKVADLLNNMRHDRVAAAILVEGTEAVETRMVRYRASLGTLLGELGML